MVYSFFCLETIESLVGLCLFAVTIQMARRFYNGTTRDLNVRVQRFPSNLIAKLFGFQQKAFFEFTEISKAVATDLT